MLSFATGFAWYLLEPFKQLPQEFRRTLRDLLHTFKIVFRRRRSFPPPDLLDSRVRHTTEEEWERIRKRSEEENAKPRP